MSKFQEDMGGFFYDILRSAGVTMVATGALENVRSIGDRVGTAIEHEARVQSIKVVKELQDAIVKAFKALEADHAALEERVRQLENELHETRHNGRVGHFAGDED